MVHTPVLPDLSGRVIVITGGNSGIGKEAAVTLARSGATVAITARDAQRGRDALAEIQQRSGSDNVEVVSLDLADFASIRSAAADVLDRFDRLDVLVNNAGLVLRHRQETVQGFEMTFGVNHLGHFLLTDLLEARLIESAPARVVVVASDAHKFARKGIDFDDLQSERSYGQFGFDAYGKTKLENVLFSNELARRLAGTGVTSNALHPGFVASNFARQGDGGRMGEIGMVLLRPFATSPEKASATTSYLAGSNDVVERTGEYWVRCAPTMPTAMAQSEEIAARLWETSEALIAESGA